VPFDWITLEIPLVSEMPRCHSCSRGLVRGPGDTGRLIAAARRGLRAIYRSGYRYKKAGIILQDLVPAARVQSSLFDAADTPASKARMCATC
jgi:hypothetical protein